MPSAHSSLRTEAWGQPGHLCRPLVHAGRPLPQAPDGPRALTEPPCPDSSPGCSLGPVASWCGDGTPWINANGHSVLQRPGPIWPSPQTSCGVPTEPLHNLGLQGCDVPWVLAPFQETAKRSLRASTGGWNRGAAPAPWPCLDRHTPFNPSLWNAETSSSRTFWASVCAVLAEEWSPWLDPGGRIE